MLPIFLIISAGDEMDDAEFEARMRSFHQRRGSRRGSQISETSIDDFEHKTSEHQKYESFGGNALTLRRLLSEFKGACHTHQRDFEVVQAQLHQPTDQKTLAELKGEEAELSRQLQDVKVKITETKQRLLLELTQLLQRKKTSYDQLLEKKTRENEADRRELRLTIGNLEREIAKFQ